MYQHSWQERLKEQHRPKGKGNRVNALRPFAVSLRVLLRLLCMLLQGVAALPEDQGPPRGFSNPQPAGAHTGAAAASDGRSSSYADIHTSELCQCTCLPAWMLFSTQCQNFHMPAWRNLWLVGQEHCTA